MPKNSENISPLNNKLFSELFIWQYSSLFFAILSLIKAQNLVTYFLITFLCTCYVKKSSCHTFLLLTNQFTIANTISTCKRRLNSNSCQKKDRTQRDCFCNSEDMEKNLATYGAGVSFGLRVTAHKNRRRPKETTCSWVANHRLKIPGVNPTKLWFLHFSDFCF